MDAMDDIQAHITSLSTSKSLVYRGLEFQFSFDEQANWYQMGMPDGEKRQMEALSRSGAVTRMDNFCDGLEKDVATVQARIARAEHEALSLSELVGKPFDQASDLQEAIAEHGKVQRALRKSNSLAAVKPEEAKAFASAVDLQKQKLRAMGFGEAVAEIEREERKEGQLAPGAMTGQRRDAQGVDSGANVDGSGGQLSGEFVGQIIKIEDGNVVQKVNRAGDTVTHSLTDLESAEEQLRIGKVATIKYTAGRAEVLSRDAAIALDL
ncbi:hypothetical protein AU476_15195 [Cupriavidus sp. UYMSc13B]|nr:hypothetical protein AU476_15195 [Cupriavidus sp. UYMSc13B]